MIVVNAIDWSRSYEELNCVSVLVYQTQLWKTEGVAEGKAALKSAS